MNRFPLCLIVGDRFVEIPSENPMDWDDALHIGAEEAAEFDKITEMLKEARHRANTIARKMTEREMTAPEIQARNAYRRAVLRAVGARLPSGTYAEDERTSRIIAAGGRRATFVAGEFVRLGDGRVVEGRQVDVVADWLCGVEG